MLCSTEGSLCSFSGLPQVCRAKGGLGWAALTLNSQPCRRKHLQLREQSWWGGLETEVKPQVSVKLRHAAPGWGVSCPSSPGCTPLTRQFLSPSALHARAPQCPGWPGALCCSGHQPGRWAWAPEFLGPVKFEGCQRFILVRMFFKKAFIHHFIKERTTYCQDSRKDAVSE